VITASYAIACDGADGQTRERLGIGRRGPGVLQHWMNLIFDADLQPYLRGRRFTSCFVTDINGTVVPRADRWLIALQYSPERGETPADFNQARTESLVRRAAGREGVSVRLFDARSWQVSAYIADRFRAGRVFIVGDAAHTMPPTGAFGGNTGIHDAHNLAWKLALVTKGSAAPQLLETYDLERRPIAEATLAQALARLAAWFKNLGERLPRTPPLLEDRTVIFGTCYGEGAFLAEESSLGELFEDPRAPSGCPGSRSPHVEIEVGTRRVALHDLTGNGFLLLVGADGMAWCEPSAILAAELGLDLQCVQVQDQSAQSRLAEAFGIKEQGAVVIRPDGIIGWRCRTGAADPAGLLHKGLQRMLGHSLPK
jgi:hypothetical protein